MILVFTLHNHQLVLLVIRVTQVLVSQTIVNRKVHGLEILVEMDTGKLVLVELHQVILVHLVLIVEVATSSLSLVQVV